MVNEVVGDRRRKRLCVFDCTTYDNHGHGGFFFVGGGFFFFLWLSWAAKGRREVMIRGLRDGHHLDSRCRSPA